jgi:hypothetical protein
LRKIAEKLATRTELFGVELKVVAIGHRSHSSWPDRSPH